MTRADSNNYTLMAAGTGTGAALTANGVSSPLYLPAGQYRAVATATNVFAYLVGIG